MGDVAFPLAKETPQLQAADLLVHLIYKDVLRRKDEGRLGTGLPAPLLAKCLFNIRGGVNDIVYHDKHVLDDLLRQTYVDQGHWDENCTVTV